MSKSTHYTNNEDYHLIGDFETLTHKTKYYKKYQDTAVNLWGLSRMGIYDRFKKGIGIESFIGYLFNLKKSVTIFFHKLSFDGDFIVKYLINKLNFKISKKGVKTIEMFRQQNRIYFIKVKRHFRINGQQYKQMLIFRCSLLLLSASVEALGKSFNIKKHDQDNTFYDYEKFKSLKEVPKKFIDYLKRDIEIVNRSLTAFYEVIYNLKIVRVFMKNNNLNLKHYLTAASIGLKLLKINLKNYNVRRPQDNKINIFIYNYKMYQSMGLFFHGGFTQFNPLYQSLDFTQPFKVKGKLWDMKSAYPFQMSKELPYGEWFKERIPNEKMIKWFVIDVKKAIIKEEASNFRILLNWKKETKERYVTYLENFRCYYLEEEWNIINKIYNIDYKIIRTYYQKTCKWCNTLVNSLFKLKQDYKDINNGGAELGIKIILNAIFGKLGQRADFENMFYLPEKLEKHNIIFEGKREFEINRISNSYWISDDYNCYFATDLQPKKKFFNKSVASYITAKQRIDLWQAIINNGFENWLYSDTDSNGFKDGYDNLKIGKSLGDWEQKTTFDYINISGAKRYILYGKDKEIIDSAFANVGTNNIYKLLDKYNYSLDLIKIPNAVLHRKNCPSGIILMPIDLEIKKGLN